MTNYFVSSGQTFGPPGIGAGDTLTVAGGGSAYGTSVAAGAIATVLSGGVAVGGVIT